ncbi:ABC transporter ATP-binding protein [Kocuria palustris]|uniref:ABC transporter ATP-binding protein n=1 Tax=Kocuria palustris TaxID=71999 RepID=UPI0011A3F6A9|nr:ABC transporter ATP-binding protein [Kocuria palustris]
MTAGAEALEIRDLVKAFPARRGSGRRRRGAAAEMPAETPRARAVDGISLTARRGEVTALLGPNGAGKTTTLECAQGLQRPTSGTVRLLGEQPWGAAPSLRARVGVMLQDGGLPQASRAGEYLRHITAMYQDPIPAEELQERLGIGSFAGTPLRRLSGGQRQRVALAAALAGRPEIVFLDEPSAGLDPQSRAAVFELIDEQRASGTAVVLTTHLLDDAQRLADHVVIVDGGTVRAAGSVTELIAGDGRSGALRIELTEHQRRRWERRPPELGRDGLRVAVDRHRVVISGAVRPQDVAAAAAWLEASGELPVSLSLQPRSLEDVFLELSGRRMR